MHAQSVRQVIPDFLGPVHYFIHGLFYLCRGPLSIMTWVIHRSSVAQARSACGHDIDA